MNVIEWLMSPITKTPQTFEEFEKADEIKNNTPTETVMPKEKIFSIPRSISITSLYSLIAQNISLNKRGNLADLSFEDGVISAVVTNEGFLWKAPITFRENEEIEIGDFEKILVALPSEERNLQVRKIGNTYRWFAMPACTAVLNRVSAIDSTKLFDSFVKNADTLGMPELRFFHEKLVLGYADFIQRDGYSYIASGLFNDDVISQRLAEALANSDEKWGLSVGYYPMKEPSELRMSKDIKIPVYEEGWNQEISILPEKDAASLFTNYLSKEVNRMEQRVKDALKKLIPESDPLFNEIVEKVDSVNRSIEEKDMIRRSAESESETADVCTPEVPETSETPEIPKTPEIPVVTEAAPEIPEASKEIPEEKTPELSEEEIERKRRPTEDAQVVAEKTGEPESKEDPIATLVKLLVETDAFKAAVKAAVAEASQPTEKPEEVARQINDNFESINKAIETLNTNHATLLSQLETIETRMKEDEKEVKTRAFEWQADLPAKVVKVKTFRPSVDRIENKEQRRIGQLDDRAQSVLDRMPAPSKSS